MTDYDSMDATTRHSELAEESPGGAVPNDAFGDALRAVILQALRAF